MALASLGHDVTGIDISGTCSKRHRVERVGCPMISVAVYGSSKAMYSISGLHIEDAAT
jgi:hypothetical protein